MLLVYVKAQGNGKELNGAISVHWISWFVTFMIYIIPAMAVYALLFAVNLGDKGSVLANTSGSLFFVFLIVYALALISFCFMVSTFVQKGNDQH